MAFEFFVVLETLDHEKGQAQQTVTTSSRPAVWRLPTSAAFTPNTVTELTIRTAVLKAPILMLTAGWRPQKR